MPEELPSQNIDKENDEKKASLIEICNSVVKTVQKDILPLVLRKRAMYERIVRK